MIALLLAAALISGSVSAHSAPDAVGWWWKLRPVSAVPGGPPAPVVPAGGFVVAADGTGNAGTPPDPQIDFDGLAVAALRFDTELAESAQLVMTSEQVLGRDPEILVCPTESSWSAVNGGAWVDRPAHRCLVQSVSAVAASDGVTFIWQLPGAFQEGDGTWNLMLVPSNLEPFAVTFAAPSADALEINAEPPPAPAPRLPNPVDDSESLTVIDIVEFLESEPINPVVGKSPVATTKDDSQPQALAPPVNSPRRSVPPDSSLTRALFAGLILAGIALFIRISNSPGHVPEGIGPLAGTRAAGVTTVEEGGIGRFRKPRSGSPPRLR